MNAPGPAKQHQQSGYVLPLTLAVLVMMTLIAAQVGRVSGIALETVISARQKIQNEYAMESAKAEILHILALAPRTQRGIGSGPQAIVPDGRTYEVNPSIRVRFQDLRGLMPLNTSLESPAPRERLESLLRTYGISKDKINAMVDALYDYRDKDDLQRINGAEKKLYTEAGILAPRNSDLLDTTEINRILGWAEESHRWALDDIQQHLSVELAQAFNPNTATARVIAAMTGMGLSDAQALVKQRRTVPDTDLAPLLYSNLGDPFGNSGFVLRSTGPNIKITLWHHKQPWAWEFVVYHTPDELAGPWRITNFRQVPLQPELIPGLPPRMLPALKELRDLAMPRIEYRF